MSRLYPLFLKLERRPVTVIGGGSVATRRVGRLLEAGARVTLISPEATPQLRALAADGRLEWHERPYAPGDLRGAELVLVATDDVEVAHRARLEARAHGILLNSAEDESASDFHVPATAEAGSLRVAIGSEGASPALTARVRAGLERWIAELGLGSLDGTRAERRRLRTELRDEPEARARALRALGEDSAGELPEPRQGARPGTVYLVGAGPGDPELLTVRALSLLETADVVFHDRLVSDEILATIPADVERVYVGKEVGCAHRANIVDLLVEAARAGRRVVRLKGGDPMLFGRGGEELLALDRAGVPAEVVPGVSAICAVPAAAGIPVTFRGVASELVVRSGHKMEPGGEAVPERAPCLDPRRETTFVYFMAVSRLAAVVEDLLGEGLSPELPIAIVERGTLPGQRVVRGTLASILELAREAEIQAPALVVAGEVVRYADRAEPSHADLGPFTESAAPVSPTETRTP